jgi:hypothetical protein
MADFPLAGPPLLVVVVLSPADLLLIGLPLLDSPLPGLLLLVEALQGTVLMSSECFRLVMDLLLVDPTLVDLVRVAEERQPASLVSAQRFEPQYMAYHQTLLIAVSATVVQYFRVTTWSCLHSCWPY